MFNFRIITCPDGTQIIDPSLKTPYSALTPVQMEEYMEIDTQIAFMERLKRKVKENQTVNTNLNGTHCTKLHICSDWFNKLI